MKILYVHQHFSTPNGNNGTRSYEMAKILLSKGHQVAMLCGSDVRGNTGLEKKFRKGCRKGIVAGINVIEFELPYSNYYGRFKRAVIFLRYVYRCICVALREDYDLIFTTSPPLTVGIVGIIAKKFRKKIFIFEVRDVWPDFPEEAGQIKSKIVLKLLYKLALYSYKLSDACIALSPGIEKKIRERVFDKQVAMIPNGCDLNLFSPLVKKNRTLLPKEIGENDFIAIFAGAHGLGNGLDAILDAATYLKKKNIQNIKFLLVGDGMMKPALMARAENDKLTNCLFINPLPKKKLPELFACVDVGLMVLIDLPGFYWGSSPNKFFDYISSGLPVVNNYPGWIASMLNDYKCGVEVSPGSPEDLGEALISLSSDRHKLMLMKSHARKLAEDCFSRKQLGESFVSFLEKFAPK